MDIDVQIDDIEEIVKKIENMISGNGKTEGLEELLQSYKSFAVGQTDIWKSKYQKIFDSHINGEFIVYCNNIIKNCKKLNNHLTKTMNNYKRIDSSRMG